MLNRKYAILAGAVAAAMPLAAKAVVITYSLNASDILVSSTGTSGPFNAISTLPVGSLTGTTAAEVLTIPSGDFVEIGASVLVTGDTYAGNAVDAPETLGVAAFQVGLADSNVAVAAVVPPYGAAAGTAIGNVVVNANFTGTKNPGQADGLGGVNAALGIAGSNTISGAYSASMSYGATAPAELYNTLKIKANGSTGTTATFTMTNNPTAFQYVVNATQGKATSSGGTVAGTFKNQTYNATTDTFAPMPTLTIIVGTPGAVTTSTSTTAAANKIISLTSGAPTSYGSQLGHSITITGKNGSYTTGNTGLVADPGATTAFTAVGTFSPAGDPEVYALKLDKSGVAIATTNTTLIAAIVNDINASNSGGIVASAVTGAYANLFPGYDVLLTAATGPSATPYLGVDFSGDTADTGVTVTEIAAVPEPATAAGVVLGAAGLLLGRRKSRVTIA